MDEIMIKQLVFELVSHPRFKNLRGREIDIFFENGELNAAAFDNSKLILENRMGLILTHTAIKLPPAQLQALLAHELAHHLHGDYRSQIFPIFVLGTFLLAALLLSFFFGILGLIAAAGLGILASGAARAGLSRMAEYRADSIAAKVVGAASVIALLMNLDVTDLEPIGRIMGLWSTHPSPENRIRKIQKKFLGNLS